MWPGYPAAAWNQSYVHGHPFQPGGQGFVNEADNWAVLARQWANQRTVNPLQGGDAHNWQNQTNASLLPPPPPPPLPPPPPPPLQTSAPHSQSVICAPNSQMNSKPPIDSNGLCGAPFNYSNQGPYSWPENDHNIISEYQRTQSYESTFTSDQPCYNNVANNYASMPESVLPPTQSYMEHCVGDSEQTFYRNEHLDSFGYPPMSHGACETPFNPNFARLPYRQHNYEGNNYWSNNLPSARPPFANRFDSPVAFEPGRPIYTNYNADQADTAIDASDNYSRVGNDEFHSCGDQDYRVFPNITHDPDKAWNDVDIRPLPVSRNDNFIQDTRVLPSTVDNHNRINKRDTIVNTKSRNPRTRVSDLPVPEHLMSAFEEAAVSTGAWPVKGSDADQLNAASSTKRKGLPAWLRDELEKLEKKKAKELAAVSGDTDLGAAPDAERDDEGDIVMEEDELKSHHENSAFTHDDVSDPEDEPCFAATQKYDRENSISRHSSSSTESTVDDNYFHTRLEGDVVNESYSGSKTTLKRINTIYSATNLSNSQAATVVHPLSSEEFRVKFAELSSEEQQEETNRFITRTLTEVLLDVTTELMLSMATEMWKSATQPTVEKLTHDIDVANVDSVVATAPIAGLVAYNSESEQDSDVEFRKKKHQTERSVDNVTSVNSEFKSSSEMEIPLPTNQTVKPKNIASSGSSPVTNHLSLSSDSRDKCSKHHRKQREHRKRKIHHSGASHSSKSNNASSRHIRREGSTSSSSRESDRMGQKSKYSSSSSKHHRHHHHHHHRHHHDHYSSLRPKSRRSHSKRWK